MADRKPLVLDAGRKKELPSGDTVPANLIGYPAALQVGSPTNIVQIQDAVEHMWSSGITHGCDITDNGNGTVSIAAGHAMLRPSADEHAALYSVGVSAQANITLTDDATNYIYIDWNSGSPTFNVSTSQTAFNCLDKCIAYMVHRSGTTLNIIDAREQNVDGNRKSRRLFMSFARFIHAEGGTVLSSPTGVDIAVTAGKFFFMLHELPHDAFDTSVAGTANANVFKLWYRNGSGGYTGTADQKTINTTTYDSGTGTPATIGNNKWGVSWVYLVHDSPSKLHVVMGQNEYADLGTARMASPPTLIPSLLIGCGTLIGFVVYQKSATSFAEIRNAFALSFSSASAVAHNNLPGLQGGSGGNYYHSGQTLETTDSPQFAGLKLGTTGKTWNTGTIAQIGSGGTHVFGDTYQAIFGSNSYYNSGWKRVGATYKPTQYNHADGVHRWYAADAGDADSEITWSQLATLSASGFSLAVALDLGANDIAAGDGLFAGNLAVGGASISAWGSGYSGIQHGANGFAVGSNSFTLSLNTYWDSGGTPRYITNDYAAAYNLFDGLHRWYSAASGSAGGSVTLTQTMTLGLTELAVAVPVSVAGNVSLGAGGKIVFEGTTDDAHETTVDPGDPTADRTLTLPDKSGTLATLDDISTVGLLVSEFRLTLTSGVPVTTSDVTGGSRIYCCPYVGNRISLYTGSAWVTRTSAEFSLALSGLTSSRPYDVFCYDNAGTPTLEFLAWTNDTTRATALTRQDGVLVKSGDATRRYLGTFYTTSTTTTEDSEKKRLLWNFYHRVSRKLKVHEATANWTYTTATWRYSNNSAANRVEVVRGVNEDIVTATAMTTAMNTAAGVNLNCGIGLDSSSALAADTLTANVLSKTAGTAYEGLSAQYTGLPGVGFHYLSWIERSGASGTTSWYGSAAGILNSGLNGECQA